MSEQGTQEGSGSPVETSSTELVKAYDLKVLGARLKVKGLIEAEHAALEIYTETKQWITESAIISKTPYDNMALIVFPQLDNLILPVIDGISDEAQ